MAAKPNIIMVFLIIALNARINAVYLDLDYYLSGCTFHLIDFHDHDLSEGILHSNQHGQPWTLRNVSHNIEPRPEEANVTVRDHDWESRFCNVHLFIRPNWTQFGFGWYAAGLAVRARNLTFVVFVFDTKTGNTLPQYPAISNLQTFGIELDLKYGSIVFTYWIHPVTHVLYWTRERHRFNGTFFSKFYSEHGSNFGGSIIHVVHRTFSETEDVSVLCPAGNTMPWRRRKHECEIERGMTQELVQVMNGTAQRRNLLEVFGGGAVLSTLLGERDVVRFYLLSNEWSSRFLLVHNRNTHLAYCDYDKQRIRNQYNWLNAFHSLAWVAVIFTGVLVVIISSISVTEQGISVNFDAYNISRLFFGGEGQIRARLHILILLIGSVLTSYYENHLTSVTLAPNPPLVYETVEELFGAGYKLRLLPRHDIPNVEIKFNSLRADRFLLRYNTSFEHTSTLAEYYSPKLLPLQARLHYEEHSASMVEDVGYHNPGAVCHFVTDIFEAILEWAEFKGYLNDEFYAKAQLILQSGIRELWTREFLLALELHNQRTRGKLLISSWPEPPPAVAIDWEAIRIFYVCGYLALVAVVLLLIECATASCSQLKNSKIRQVPEPVNMIISDKSHDQRDQPGLNSPKLFSYTSASSSSSLSLSSSSSRPRRLDSGSASITAYPEHLVSTTPLNTHLKGTANLSKHLVVHTRVKVDVCANANATAETLI